VRPSYVIAGRGMRIVYNAEELNRYIHEAVDVSERRPVLIDRYVEDAVECEIDGISDRKRLFIGGIMEHVEKAGIHSGDASCVTPPVKLSKEIQKRIVGYSRKISSAIGNIGAINIQFAVQGKKVFVLEANPRASRTVPYLSKATGIPLAKIATKIALGHGLDEYGLRDSPKLPYYAVKSVVFPFLKLPGTDFVLGPEMKSTGESMGVDIDFGRAYYKALLGANLDVYTKGKLALSLRPDDRKYARKLADKFSRLGFELVATEGTARAIGEGIPVRVVKKVSEGEPNIRTKILSGEVSLVVNTPKKGRDALTDGFKIRRSAIEANVPCITSIEAALGIAEAIKCVKENELTIEPLSYYTKKVRM
jgi:carbamoyl-phosphate synthase large subunit